MAHIGSRVPGQQDPCFDHVRGILVRPGLVPWRLRKAISPAGGAFQISTHQPQAGTQRARFVRLASHLIQVEILDDLQHLPGRGRLARKLMDQGEALYAVAHRAEIARISEVEHPGKVLSCGGQLVALVMHQAKDIMPPTFEQAGPTALGSFDYLLAV